MPWKRSLTPGSPAPRPPSGVELPLPPAWPSAAPHPVPHPEVWAHQNLPPRALGPPSLRCPRCPLGPHGPQSGHRGSRGSPACVSSRRAGHSPAGGSCGFQPWEAGGDGELVQALGLWVGREPALEKNQNSLIDFPVMVSAFCVLKIFSVFPRCVLEAVATRGLRSASDGSLPVRCGGGQGSRAHRVPRVSQASRASGGLSLARGGDPLTEREPACPRLCLSVGCVSAGPVTSSAEGREVRWGQSSFALFQNRVVIPGLLYFPIGFTPAHPFGPQRNLLKFCSCGQASAQGGRGWPADMWDGTARPQTGRGKTGVAPLHLVTEAHGASLPSEQPSAPSLLLFLSVLAFPWRVGAYRDTVGVCVCRLRPR